MRNWSFSLGSMGDDELRFSRRDKQDIGMNPHMRIYIYPYIYTPMNERRPNGKAEDSKGRWVK